MRNFEFNKYVTFSATTVVRTEIKYSKYTPSINAVFHWQIFATNLSKSVNSIGGFFNGPARARKRCNSPRLGKRFLYVNANFIIEITTYSKYCHAEADRTTIYPPRCPIIRTMCHIPIDLSRRDLSNGKKSQTGVIVKEPNFQKIISLNNPLFFECSLFLIRRRLGYYVNITN